MTRLSSKSRSAAAAAAVRRLASLSLFHLFFQSVIAALASRADIPFVSGLGGRPALGLRPAPLPRAEGTRYCPSDSSPALCNHPHKHPPYNLHHHCHCHMQGQCPHPLRCHKCCCLQSHS